MPKKIILASASPRRKQLLSTLIDGFEIAVPDSVELDSGKPTKVALTNALAKAQYIKEFTTHKNCPIIIACDTVVSRKNQIYGKPKDREHALQILSQLRGLWHQVISGVAVLADREYSYYVKSKVFIHNLSDEELLNYIDEYSPYDKAGAYGIQDKIVVKRYSGDYDNIVGLPLQKLQKILMECGVHVKK